MTDFTFHTIETAPEEVKATLEAVQEKYGFIPNLFAYMANAPVTLNAYLQLNELVSQTSFSPEQQQVALLTVSVENKCNFCSAAHRAFAKMNGANVQTVDAIITNSEVQDASDAALVSMVRSMVQNRGWQPETDQQAFLDAGFTKQQLLEITLIVSIKTLSNYVNHMTGTQANEELLAMV